MKHNLWLKQITLTLIVFTGLSAQANNVVKTELGFIHQPLNINNQDILSAAALLSEQQWASFPNQQSYRPAPQFRSLKNLDPVDLSENLEVFRAETAFLVNTEAITSLFSGSSGLDILNKIDDGFRHQQVSADQVNSAYGEQLEDDYASAQEVMEVRGRRLLNPLSGSELNIAIENLNRQYDYNRSQNWCMEPNTQCLMSQAVFDGSWAFLVDTVRSLPLDSHMEVPSELEQYAEIKKILDPELAAQHPGLEGIQLKAQGLFEVTGFMSNALVQFSNIVVSIHPLPEGQSVVIIQTTVGMEKNDLDKVDTPLLSARSLLMGQSIYNGDSGFSLGLPRLQESMARQLKGLAR